MFLLSSVFFLPSPQKKSTARGTKIQITAMSKNPPSPPSPNAPSDHHPESGRLGATFKGMFLDAAHAADGGFINNWGVVNTEEALALSNIDDARLKCCIVDASASVWGVPTLRPGQLEACYCLLHSSHLQLLALSIWSPRMIRGFSG